MRILVLHTGTGKWREKASVEERADESILIETHLVAAHVVLGAIQR